MRGRKTYGNTKLREVTKKERILRSGQESVRVTVAKKREKKNRHGGREGKAEREGEAERRRQRERDR